MPLSPAQQHRVKTEASHNAQQLAHDEHHQGAANALAHPLRSQTYRAHVIKLQRDLTRLAKIKSQQRRLMVKRELLPDYQTYIEGVLASPVPLDRAKPYHDKVLVWCLVWLLDVGELTQAMPLARYALAHEMQAPDGFNRSLLELVIEMVSRDAMGFSSQAYRQTLEEVQQWANDQDMSDSIRAGLYKAYALVLDDSEAAQALALFQQAYALSARVGVKQHINRLQRQLNPPTAKKEAKPVLPENHHYTISTRQAARLLGVANRTLTQALMVCFPDELPCIKAAKATHNYQACLFREADLKAFMDKRLHGRKPDSVWRSYTVSASKAAKMLNLGQTRFDRYLLLYPEQLPYVDYTTSPQRRTIRFCEEDIKRFIVPERGSPKNQAKQSTKQ